ncbi:MAG: DUF2953 domain-containing protein [Bacillota bacterium]
MAYFFTVALLIIIVTTLIVMLPLRLDVIYKKVCKNDLLQIDMGISGFPILRLRIPSLGFHPKTADQLLGFPAQLQLGRKITLWERYYSLGQPLELLEAANSFFSGKTGRILLKSFPDLRKILRQFLKNVTCNRLVWATKIGSDDAFLTGYGAGLLWWIKFSLYRLLSRNVKLAFSRPYFQVIPDFEKRVLDLKLNCIFEVSIGHIIIAGLKTLWIILRFLVRG